MNIGASGTAASMGSAYGAGAVRSPLVAVALVAGSSLAGAIVGGLPVMSTITSGIVPTDVVSIEVATIVLASACITLLFANIAGIPLSTSEVTVGSLIGVGIALHAIHVRHLVTIVAAWFVLPVVAFLISYLAGRASPAVERRLERSRCPSRAYRLMSIILVVGGVYEAFSAGMNHVANAVGPIVATGAIGSRMGIWIGATFIALGAITLGRRVLETNGKKITRLSPVNGCVISFTSGTLVVIASLLGLPVPLTQATTLSIFGIGVARREARLWNTELIVRTVAVWVLSPIGSLAISYALVRLLVQNSWHAVAALVALSGASLAFIGIRRAGSSRARGQRNVT